MLATTNAISLNQNARYTRQIIYYGSQTQLEIFYIHFSLKHLSQFVCLGLGAKFYLTIVDD
jgi:hypothetical protein